MNKHKFKSVSEKTQFEYEKTLRSFTSSKEFPINAEKSKLNECKIIENNTLSIHMTIEHIKYENNFRL